jgi:hypothetical protein
MAGPNILQALSFQEILPLLTSTYRAGRLVPFIGAGMSRPRLADWEGFVENLERLAGITPSPGEPQVRAQRAAAKIRNSGTAESFFAKIRESLKVANGYAGPKIPPQTKALAQIFWPLTISTNYDDLFYGACREVHETRLDPLLLGRSAGDCKRVMSALSSPFDREIVWHIQGFVGGQHSDHLLQEEAAELPRLSAELVIGHSEYRQVANTAVHFRRCFGEVFRSRSFLFLGSSLSEEYFWNLFGEMLELCGPSSVSHFALISRNDRVDVRFLAEQMNITVYQYDDHAELPGLLRTLKDSIDQPEVRMARWSVQARGGAVLEVVPHAALPVPDMASGASVALVVGSDETGHIEVADVKQEELSSKFQGKRFGTSDHVLSPEPGLFAVRAITGDPTKTNCIGSAVDELFHALDSACRELHLHLPSAGGTVPPVYGFIETVRAYGTLLREHASPPRLIAYVGSQILLNLTAQQIDLHELLASELIRFWTVVNPVARTTSGTPYSEVDREPIRRVLYKCSKTLIGSVAMEVLSDVAPAALKDWKLSVCPSSHHHPESVTVDKVADKTICDAGIAFGSVLTLDRLGSVSASRGASAS